MGIPGLVRDEGTERRPRRRPREEAPERLPWLRYDRMARAVTERLRVRPVPGQPFWVLAVRNPIHHTHYRVLLPEFPSGEAQFCSCPDFARRGIGTCKHVEAGTAWLAGHPEMARTPYFPRGATRIWRAVDRARIEALTSHRPDAVRLRQPGRVLFERAAIGVSHSSKKRVGGKGSVESAGQLGV